MNESVTGALAHPGSFKRPSSWIGALVRIARETVIGRSWLWLVGVGVDCENATDGATSETRTGRQ